MIRSGGVGAMSTVARLGALVAPFVPLLSRYYEPLPLFLFGVVSLVGGLLALSLPETLSLKLPDTVAEAEQIGRPPAPVTATAAAATATAATKTTAQSAANGS